MAQEKQIAQESRSVRSAELSAELSVMGTQLNASQAEFLKVDVETALTFAGLALETNNEEKRERNRKNARKAYDSIRHLSINVHFTLPQKKHIREKLSVLRNQLKTLGENF